MMDLNGAFSFDGQCANCPTRHACGAYRQCVQKPMVKAHPAAQLVDPVLARVTELSGAETAGFLPESPAAE